MPDEKDAALPTPQGEELRVLADRAERAQLKSDYSRLLLAAADTIDRLTQQLHEAQQERDRLTGIAAACYRISGADPDGNEDWRLADDAIRAVSELRNAYDESTHYCEVEKARAEQAEAALTQARAEGRREGLESLRREFEAWRDVELREQPSRPAVDVLRVAVNAINANIAAGDALRAPAPHTCHDMNPPHPAPCSACERECALATSPATPDGHVCVDGNAKRFSRELCANCSVEARHG